MNMQTKSTISTLLLLVLASPSGMAANAYQCPSTTPVDSQHNRSGWYIGHYTPQSGSYAGSIATTQNLSIKADALINTASTAHQWSQSANGNASAKLATGSITMSAPYSNNVSSNLNGLNSVSPAWRSGPGETQWPAAVAQGAMHSIITQRNHLKSSANQARQSHAMNFVRANFEYRQVGSTDNVVDGVSQGQLLSGGELLDIEITTEYLTPDGWGNNDYCWRLFNNNNGMKGFEIQVRPVVHVLGQNLSLIENIPDIAGEYEGTIELAYDNLPSSRPVY